MFSDYSNYLSPSTYRGSRRVAYLTTIFPLNIPFTRNT